MKPIEEIWQELADADWREREALADAACDGPYDPDRGSYFETWRAAGYAPRENDMPARRAIMLRALALMR